MGGRDPDRPTLNNTDTPEQRAPRASFVLLNEIGIISQLASARLESVLPMRMTMAQFRVLNHFSRLGGESNINRLAQAFQVSKPTMGGVVDSLLRKKLVNIRPDPNDQRGKLVSINPEGRDAHRAAIVALGPDLDALERAIGLDNIDSLIGPLQALRRYLDESR
jgi:DNA-binding MarR family transcriptional regulator